MCHPVTRNQASGRRKGANELRPNVLRFTSSAWANHARHLFATEKGDFDFRKSVHSNSYANITSTVCSAKYNSILSVRTIRRNERIWSFSEIIRTADRIPHIVFIYASENRIFRRKNLRPCLTNVSIIQSLHLVSRVSSGTRFSGYWFIPDLAQ